MRFVGPIILILVAAAVYFGYTAREYSDIKSLLLEEKQFDDALKSSNDLNAESQRLTQQYNSFAPEDVNRLEKLLPDNIDNVRLILNIDDIASRYGLILSNVAISEGSITKRSTGSSGMDVGSVELQFGVKATYKTFKQFLADLERSLRIVDVMSLSFNQSEIDKETGEAENAFSLRIKTYWLK